MSNGRNPDEESKASSEENSSHEEAKAEAVSSNPSKPPTPPSELAKKQKKSVKLAAKPYRPQKGLAGLPRDLIKHTLPFLTPEELSHFAATTPKHYALMQGDKSYQKMWEKLCLHRGLSAIKSWRTLLEGRQFQINYSDSVRSINGARAHPFNDVLNLLDDHRAIFISNGYQETQFKRLDLSSASEIALALAAASDTNTPLLLKRRVLLLPEDADAGEGEVLIGAAPVGGLPEEYYYSLYGMRNGLWQETDLDAGLFANFNFANDPLSVPIYENIRQRGAHLPKFLPGIYAVGAGLLPLDQLKQIFERYANSRTSLTRSHSGAYMSSEAMSYIGAQQAAFNLSNSVKTLLSSEIYPLLVTQELTVNILSLYADDLKSLLSERFLQALAQGLIPKDYAWPWSGNPYIHQFLAFLMSDDIFPILSSGDLSFSQIMAIERAFEKDSDFSHYGTENFLKALLANPEALTALKEGLVSVEQMNVYCEKLNYHSSNRHAQPVILDPEFLPILFSPTALQIFRQKHIDPAKVKWKKSLRDFHTLHEGDLIDQGLTPGALAGYQQGLFRWQDLRAMNDRYKIALVTSEKGREILAEKQPGNPALSLIPLDAFNRYYPQIKQLLSFTEGLPALRSGKYTLPELAMLDPSLIELMLTAEGQQLITKDKKIAKQPGKIDFAELRTCKVPQALAYLISDEGQVFLKENPQWSVRSLLKLYQLRQAAKGGYDEERHQWVLTITSKAMRPLLERGLVTPEAVRAWSVAKLKLLFDQSIQQLLPREGVSAAGHSSHAASSSSHFYRHPTNLMSLALLEGWSIDGVKLMTSTLGKLAWSAKLITQNDTKKYNFDLLTALITPSGLLAMLLFPNWRKDQPFDDLAKMGDIFAVMHLYHFLQNNSASAAHSSVGSETRVIAVDKSIPRELFEQLTNKIAGEVHRYYHWQSPLPKAKVDHYLALLQQLYSLSKDHFSVAGVSAQKNPWELRELELRFVNSIILQLVADLPKKEVITEPQLKMLNEYRKLCLSHIKSYLAANPPLDADELEDVMLKHSVGLEALDRIHPEKKLLSKTHLEDMRRQFNQYRHKPTAEPQKTEPAAASSKKP